MADPTPNKRRNSRNSLHPLTTEEALKRILDYRVEPKPRRGGRKKKDQK